MLNPDILKDDEAKNILKKIYSSAQKRSLIINDGYGDWEISEVFPQDCDKSLLLMGTKKKEILLKLLEILIECRDGIETEEYYFLQEEYRKGEELVSLKLNTLNLKQIVSYYEKMSHLNFILISSDGKFTLKLIHEGIGLLCSNDRILEKIRRSQLREFIEEPRWKESQKKA
ncbi:MAG: hypothetical protein HYZ66_09430 [Chlamydiae bacterium]|nr:hypothetical protein [Chlamydiota bacterium]